MHGAGQAHAGLLGSSRVLLCLGLACKRRASACRAMRRLNSFCARRAGDLESEPERAELAHAPSSERAESPVTPLSSAALKRWDARSASAHSLVSSEAASAHADDGSSRLGKKLR